MSKKRMFDIEFPDDTQPVQPMPSPAEDGARRGPMATAISENAGALRDRAELEKTIREENDRIAHEHVRMKRDGLITDLIPLELIRTGKLRRDRNVKRDAEIDELKTSIRSIGLSNPIRVEVVGEHYELIQGFRRLTAYRELFEDTGDAIFARIPAGLVAEGDALELLYRRMVDENLVRRDISFAEMAILAGRYARDAGTTATSVDDAIAVLYASAGRQKRNYIAHFASLMDRLEPSLKWPEAIPRALGLELERLLSDNERMSSAIVLRLENDRPATAKDELAILRAFVGDGPVSTKVSGPVRKSRVGAKTTLRVSRPEGLVKCIASEGRIEVRGETDFSSIDRARLERALTSFLDEIYND